MKKTLLFVLMALLSVTTHAIGFTVNGITYEHLGGYDLNARVVGLADGVTCPDYLEIPSTVTNASGTTYNVTEISSSAFERHEALVSVWINDNVEAIGENAFAGCTNLKYIRLPETLNTIGHPFFTRRGAFEGCTSLEFIYLPRSLNHQPYVTSPNNICKWAFKNCTNLKTIVIAAEYPVIEDEAFLGCNSLIYLVSNVAQPWALEPNTFQGIPSSATLIVPDGTRSSYLGLAGWNSFSTVTERSNSTRVFATITAGLGGKVSSGSMEVQHGMSVWPVSKGGNLVLTITPDEGHKLLRLLKDGQDVTALVSNGQYTVQSVQQDFRLEAVFEEGSTPDPQPSTGGTAKLSIEPFSINAGETATMLIDMTNPDDEITALDFFMQLPQGLSIAVEDGEPAVDIAGRTTWKKHTLTVNTTDGHIMLYSATNATVSGTSGALISVKLQASSTFAGGDIVLKDQTLNTADVPLPVVSKPADYIYTITVEQPTLPQLELTRIEVLNAVDGVVHSNDVKLRWQIANNSQQDFTGYIYLTTSKLENGSWKKEYTPEKYQADINSGDTYGNNFVFYFWNYADGKYKYEMSYAHDDNSATTSLGSIEFEVNNHSAWRSIVFLWHDMQTYCDNTDLDFTSVEGLKAYTAGGFNTATGEALMMRVGSVPAKEGLLLVGEPWKCYLVPRVPSQTIYVNMLKGYYSEGGTGKSIPATENNCSNYKLDAWSKTFKAVGSNGYIDGKDAYLQIPAQAAGSRQSITLKFDDTNDISDMETEGRPFDVYSVNGTLVKRGATSLKGLPTGIYVVRSAEGGLQGKNGRKVVVK